MNKVSIILIVLLTLGACGEDYPEGPEYELRTETTRICATWKVKEIAPRREGLEPDKEDMLFYIQKDGSFSARTPIHINMMGFDTIVVAAMSGTWQWANGKKSIRMKATDLATGTELDETNRILKLAFDEFWFEQTDTSTGTVHTLKCVRL
jgi:hypothetical protein